MHSALGPRLLTIGEIFDRAVHLTIANILPLVAIVGLVTVPIRAIGDWLDRDALNQSFSVDGKIVADPRLIANYFTLIRDPHAHSTFWSGQLWFFASLFPLSLAIAAASIATQIFLNGEKAELGAAYRSALRRLGPIFGATILAWAAYLAAIIADILVVIAFWSIWFVVLKIAGGGTSAAPLAGIAAMMFSLFVAAIVWIIPLGSCTTTGAALYGIRPQRAIREAWEMTMSRGLRVRTLAFGAAFLALTVVQEFFRLVVCGLLSDVTHSTWLAFVASGAITLLALIIGMALAVVFYLDARNRVGLVQDPLAKRENSQSQ
jgi:hypothetical protein